VFAVRLGIALEIVGVAGIGVVAGPATAWWATVPVLFVYGLGVGLATAQLTGVVLADVPVANSGQASGTQSTSRQIGSAFGIAILGTVLFTALGAQLSQRLSGIPGMPAGERSALVAGVKQSAGTVIGQLAASPRTAAVAAMAKEAFSQATRLTAFTAAAFLALGLLASLSLGRGNTSPQVEPAGAGPGQQRGPAAQDPGKPWLADSATPRLPAEPQPTAHRGSRPGHSPTGSTTSFRPVNQGAHGGLKRA